MAGIIKVKCNHESAPDIEGVFSVFQNEHGEQWVAAWRGDELVIAGGDMDWKEVVVTDESLKSHPTGWKLHRDSSGSTGQHVVPPGIARVVFTPEEFLWVLSVLRVALTIASHRAAAPKAAPKTAPPKGKTEGKEK